MRHLRTYLLGGQHQSIRDIQYTAIMPNRYNSIFMDNKCVLCSNDIIVPHSSDRHSLKELKSTLLLYKVSYPALLFHLWELTIGSDEIVCSVHYPLNPDLKWVKGFMKTTQYFQWGSATGTWESRSTVNVLQINRTGAVRLLESAVQVSSLLQPLVLLFDVV